jgi:hypothetical protein
VTPRSPLRALSGAALLVGVLVAPVAAQAPGFPVYGGGFSPTIEIEGLLAFPGADTHTGDGLALGATGTFSLGRIGVWATAGRFLASTDGVDDRMVYGAMLGVKVVGGALSPLAVYVQGGAGSMEDDDPNSTIVLVPVGLAASLTIPTPFLAIRPWVAPRIQFGLEMTNGETETSPGAFGVSAGVDLTLLTGLSFRASYDRMKHQDGTVGLGVALHF